ncbi:MAG: CBS domain-containing protein [Candidatus Micrarchaeota archaeon]|nr:CBS domain-containing protein [Candidatus Micrarchaeota archaeon]
MKVRDFMTRDVVSLRPEESLKKAVEKLTSRGISGAPVTDGKKVVGILTERDVLEAIDVFFPKIRTDTGSFFSVLLSLLKSKDFSEIRKNAEKIRVKDVMKPCKVFISPDKDLLEAARLMNRHNVNRIPVVENGKLVGIITRADIIRAMT